MDSLAKRLAGPSTAKAGMDTVDQAKVNDMIFKASDSAGPVQGDVNGNIQALSGTAAMPVACEIRNAQGVVVRIITKPGVPCPGSVSSECSKLRARRGT